MSYKSPIEVIAEEARLMQEDNVVRAVQSYGIKVDKQRLIKALEFDLDQYKAGYKDAIKDMQSFLKGLDNYGIIESED